MKVVVANPTFAGDAGLRAALLARFPGAVFNDTGRILDDDALRDLLAGATAAIIGLERVDAALLDRCPDLRVIAKFGVGLDAIDLAGCAARGIAVRSTPGVNALAVAELTLGFMIGLARRIAIASHQLRQGRWIRDGGVQLFGRTVGIIGLGNVGRATARVVQAVGCPVIAHDLVDLGAYCADHAIRFTSLDELLRDADVVTVHVPLTPRTRPLIGRAELAAMKPGAFLINTARGGVVDEDALCDALAAGALGGAASDVFADEPTRNTRLLGFDNFLATPHVGGNSREAIRAVGLAAIDHLTAALDRQPIS